MLNFDITDRKQTEQAHKESEHNLKERIKELNGIFSLGKLTEEFNKLEDIYNKSVNIIIPESMQFPEKVFVSLEIESKKYCNIENFKLIESRKYLSAPIKIFGKQAGELIVAYTEDLPFIDFFEQELINNYAERISKITERITIQQVHKESESSLRNAQEIAKMGSWEWDMVTQKTNWSDNYFAIHGFKPNEVEPTFELFRSRIHPDDVHFLDETHARIMKDKTPSSFELRLIQPDGTIKWIQNNISPVIEDDKLVKLKGVIIDVTERKQAEEDWSSNTASLTSFSLLPIPRCSMRC